MKRLLLDTNVWLRWSTSDGKLTRPAREAIVEETNMVYFSVASAWEIAIKSALGKLTVAGDLAELESLLARQTIAVLPVELRHAVAVAQMPQHHRDPFDRIIIAQAQVDHLTLVTTDRQLAVYDVPIIRA